jgi:hypothetical protein
MSNEAIYLGTNSGIFQSTDNGNNWNVSNSGLTDRNVLTLAAKDSFLFAGTQYDGAFISIDRGLSWKAIDSGLSYPIPTSNMKKSNNNSIKDSSPNFITVNSLTIIDSNLFACTGGGICISKNNGTSWTPMIKNWIFEVLTFAMRDSIILAATDNGVVVSLDNGTSWNFYNNSLTNKHVCALTRQGLKFFAGTLNNGIFCSIDNGITWSSINFGLSDSAVVSLITKGSNMFAGTAYEGVFLSTNSGQQWVSINSGLTNYKTKTLFIKDSTLFVGLYCGSIWRRSLSEITSVKRLSTDLPTHFSLEQNFPNPFNPATTISFSLPSKSFVSLKVFDIIGREVATIVFEEMSTGIYSRQWNAENMSSGIYFYRLQVGSFIETKKLVLLR